MSGFLNRCVLEAATDQDDGKWVLVRPLFYVSDVAKQTFTVPAGFQTDLASVPRLPIVYLLTGDTSSAAAVVHDWLYSSHMVTRAMADAVLKEASQATGVPGWRRWLMWCGVRLGGASHWNAEPPNTDASPAAPSALDGPALDGPRGD
jgi:hypothetical protein